MAITEKTVMTTEAVYNDGKTHRYLLYKEWDSSKPKAAIIMLYPSNADAVSVDHTTMFVLRNLERLGYGGVNIVNLFSSFNGKHNKADVDENNMAYIYNAAQSSKIIIWAVGMGAHSCKTVLQYQDMALDLLKEFKARFKCIADATGRKFYHPLCPAVRNWVLKDFKPEELRSSNSETDGKDDKTEKQAEKKSKNNKGNEPQC